MSVIIRDLQEINKDKTILVAAAGRLFAIERIVTNQKMPQVILVALEKPRETARFNAEVDGFLIGAVSFGIPVEVIADLLEREVAVIQRRMKKIGLSYL